MTDRNSAAALENLKRKGFALEKQLNELIQSNLNREEFAQYADLGSELLARRMRNVKENVELLSFQYNFPTKNDVASLARLIIQLEEKMEGIEEQLTMVSRSLKQVQRKMQIQSYQNERKEKASKRVQTKGGNVVLSKDPGKDSKVVQLERWFSI